MPVPTLISSLSTTVASNSPAGSEAPTDGDNHIRTLYAFIASIAANSGNGWTTPYLALAGGTLTGGLTGTTATFSGAGSFQNLTYTGTLTGSTGAINIGSGQITKDSSGNVGLSATLNTWSAGLKALQINTRGAVYASTSSTVVADNLYNDGTVKHIATAAAAAYTVGNGEHSWVRAASASAGSAATLVECMSIDVDGNVVPVVTATPPTLDTNGQMVFNLTSNTNLRISVRGSDGTTRVANITLA